MNKQDMERPDQTHTKPTDATPSAPELQVKTKNDKHPAGPIISGAFVSEQKAFQTERPISKAYRAIDNDLARDNIENDLPEGDLNDL